MSIAIYLETAPLYEIDAYRGGPPQDAVSFDGSPRKHPYEREKLLLVRPFGSSPAILEFKLSDVVHAEDLPSPVTERGEGMRIVRIWVRRGSFGIMHEPFEVDDPVKLSSDSAKIHERIMRSFG